MKWFFRCWLLVLPIAGHAQAPVWLWATVFHASAGVQMQSITSAANNGCFAHGSFGTALYLPFDTLVDAGGAGNYFLAHVDTLGTVTWAAQFSDPVVSMHGSENDGVSCLVPFNGSTIIQGQVVNGSTEGTSALVVEFDNSGALVDLVVVPGIIVTTGTSTPYMHHAAGSGIVIIDVVTDSTTVLGTVVLGPGRVLARILPSGELLWAELVDAGESGITGVAHIDAIGRSLVCAPDGVDGVFSSYDPSGMLDWQVSEVYHEIFDPPVMTRRVNGDPLLALGHPSQGPIGLGTMLEVSYYDLSGTPTWYATTSGTTSWYHGITSLDAIDGGASLVGGRYVGPLTFGTIPVTSNGPNGFVGLVDSAGSWLWIVSETSGNVFGFHSAPGANTRIYTTGNTDTGASFGGHQVSTNMGNFTGFVACLGDVTLNTPDTGSPFETLLVWPNPATSMLHLSQRFGQGQVLRIIDPSGRTIESRSLDPSATTIDISDLGPGIYVLDIDGRRARIVKQ